MAEKKKRKSKKKYEEDFKYDLKLITTHRIERRVSSAIEQMFCQALLKRKKKEWQEVTQEFIKDYSDKRKELYPSIMKDELKLISSEFSRYKKIHGEYIYSTYEKARDQGDSSLWKIIRWDKAWLFTDWVRQKILEKEDEDDRAFFDRLSSALKKNTRFSLQSKSKDKGRVEENKRLLTLIRKVKNTLPIRTGEKTMKEFNKELHEHLIELGKLEKDDALFDQNYFMKLLKRHGLGD